MDLSKIQGLIFDDNPNYNKEEIKQSPCECKLCIDDVKPLQYPQKERLFSTKEFKISETEALHFYLQKLYGFRGLFTISDCYFLGDGQLYYTSDFGKLKCKEKQTNIEAKKHLDEKRKKFQRVNKTKEMAMLTFKDGSHQLMTQTHFNKVILKRKNDPLWLEAKSIILLPPTTQKIQYKEYKYKRNQDTMIYMRPITEKIVEDVDAYDDKLNKDDALKNISYIMTMSKSKLGISLQLETMINQSIAYIEVVHKIRVLGATFRYFEDVEGQPYLIEILNFVAQELIPSEQELAIHDRFRPLDQIGEEQLKDLKQHYDHQDEELLWSRCQEVTKVCIQNRKHELKLKECKKLSSKELRLVFLRIFPDFSTASIFQNSNWQNELGEFLKDCKRKISKLIRADEGISILKRYGITFYRTF